MSLLMTSPSSLSSTPPKCLLQLLPLSGLSFSGSGQMFIKMLRYVPFSLSLQLQLFSTSPIPCILNIVTASSQASLTPPSTSSYPIRTLLIRSSFLPIALTTSLSPRLSFPWLFPVSQHQMQVYCPLRPFTTLPHPSFLLSSVVVLPLPPLFWYQSHSPDDQFLTHRSPCLLGIKEYQGWRGP